MLGRREDLIDFFSESICEHKYALVHCNLGKSGNAQTLLWQKNDPSPYLYCK